MTDRQLKRFGESVIILLIGVVVLVVCLLAWLGLALIIGDNGTVMWFGGLGLFGFGVMAWAALGELILEGR